MANSKKGTAVTVAQGLTEAEIAELDRPKRVLSAAVESGNLDEVWAYGQALNQVFRTSGLNKMQLVAGLRREWPQLQAKGAVEDEVENVIEAYLGMTPANFKKYADAWDRLIEEQRIPAKLQAQWFRKPVEHWLAISAAAVDGLSAAQWDRATVARQVADVKEIVRSVRGSKTSSKNRLTIQLKRKDGVLMAWKGKSKPVAIGVLKTTAEDRKDPVINDAVDRIINAAGIVVQ